MKLTIAFSLVVLALLFGMVLSCKEFETDMDKCAMESDVKKLGEEMVKTDDKEEKMEIYCKINKKVYPCIMEVIENYKNNKKCDTIRNLKSENMELLKEAGCGAAGIGASIAGLVLSALVRLFVN